ncbi:hypothetical protein VNO78_34339 [Psophocarpus tetragonolobus]|uniref:Uncharacterized protein n=1 Tax=Psophocarpus tetragonolobus TaxID=3891 RepID=A0AAN9NV79_PSOTE
MDTEDLNFPKIGDTGDLPHLWNISPKGLSDPYQVPRKGTKGDEEIDFFEAKLVSKGHSKSYSCVQNGKKITRLEDEEVPMDLLWEVFNEELSSETEFSTSSSRELVEFRRAKTLTVAKTGTALVQTKNRPGMVVILKVLKKFFTLSNNSQLKLFWQSD